MLMLLSASQNVILHQLWCEHQDSWFCKCICCTCNPLCQVHLAFPLQRYCPRHGPLSQSLSWFLILSFPQKHKQIAANCWYNVLVRSFSQPEQCNTGAVCHQYIGRLLCGGPLHSSPGRPSSPGRHLCQLRQPHPVGLHLT